MKIEKINENQIRCTLTSEDLTSRKLKLSELAYGTERARDLFRDMMQKAYKEFGFRADNIPLMIEAIPLSMDSVVLIISKVEDPEELDTRFSKFSEDREAPAMDSSILTGADELIDIFQKLHQAKAKADISEKDKEQTAEGQTEREAMTDVLAEEKEKEQDHITILQMFYFTDLDHVIAASKALGSFYQGKNTLYKNRKDASFQLILERTEESPEDFNKICNTLSEYGSRRSLSEAGQSYLKEHGQIFLSSEALQTLGNL